MFRTYRHVPIALYSLLNDAPDDGLMIVRNMWSQIMKNKDYSQESVQLVGLYTHCNMMHGTYNVKSNFMNIRPA